MKNTFTFPHDYGARNDPELQRLIFDIGPSAGWAYWVIIEMLYEQGGRLPKRSYNQIAYAAHVSEEVIKSIVEESELFETDEHFFWSDRVEFTLGYKEEKSAKNRTAAQKKWDKWKKDKELTDKDTDGAMRTLCERNANAERTLCHNNNSNNNSNNTSSLHSEVSPSQNELEPRQSENDDLFQGENEADAPSEEKLLSRRQCQQVIDFWNRSVASKQSGLPSVKTLTEDRMAKIRVRWREFKGIGDPVEICKTIFEKANGSKFMAGDNKSGWKASFDWLFTNGKNWTKVYEGNYDDRELNIGSKVASSHNLIDKWNN